MTKNSNNKSYDLEERTFQFAKDVRVFIKDLGKSIAKCRIGKRINSRINRVEKNIFSYNRKIKVV